MKHVIIGNGVAGVSAAQSIRQADESAEIHIISEEPYLYYYRPKLWELIAGKSDEEAVFYREQSFYDEQKIQVHLGVKAEALMPEAHQIKLSDGTLMGYDRVLLATGGHAFVPPIEGADLEGVFSLRDLDDTHALITYADRQTDAVVIGGGLLGLETAYSLQNRGLKVTVVEFMPHLLPRQLDRPAAERLQAMMEEMGLNFITGGTTEKIACENERLVVYLTDGRVINTGLVLFSTGIRSNAGLAKDAGLKIGRCVIVDEYMRTSAKDVFAAGDVAEFHGMNYGIIPAAREQGVIAAANMVEEGSQAYPGTTPSTRLKVVGISVASIGEATVEEDGLQILRKENGKDEYLRLTLRDGKITGAIMLGAVGSFVPLKRLIDQEVDVSGVIDHLLDDGFDFKALAKG
ncbi:MAG: NAD(P)/FAD-dependent oxidoreductase [Anaerolineaceae bacterium]|nr:NAD(P)/FAD-dependent oxidoreductase [Anaerolineaceae bacterium]